MSELNIKKIRFNPSLEGMAEVLPDITYSSATGKEIKLSIITPWRDRQNKTEVPRYPLIIFVQGSGWTFPNINYEIPQLSCYAQNGYVVATVTHRNCLEGHPFPAFLQDVKTAIRFMRKNADIYGIDPERVGIWGTSSGGNTALLVGLTKDEPMFTTEEYSGFSDGVKCVVDCFGPTDINQICSELMSNPAEDSPIHIFKALMGKVRVEDYPERLNEMSPIWWVNKRSEFPSFLLLHGDADLMVPYEQSVIMHRALLNAGASSEMVCVENGPHEGSFWSKQIHDIILEFFRKNL
jgi:acetyl esterase/lipase